MGNPSCFSAMARLSQSCLQVEKRFYVTVCSESPPSFLTNHRVVRTAGEKRCAISLLAYRLHNMQVQFHLFKQDYSARCSPRKWGLVCFEGLHLRCSCQSGHVSKYYCFSSQSSRFQVNTQDVDGLKEVMSSQIFVIDQSGPIKYGRLRSSAFIGIFPTCGVDRCPRLLSPSNLLEWAVKLYGS